MTVSIDGAHRLRLAILTSASLIGLAAAAPALAQDKPADSADSSENEAAAIVVTGTRIQLSPGMSTPVPVTSVQATELKEMAPTTLVEGLSALPQFYGNTTQQANAFFSTGSSGGLNLRGLGVNRTLVLLNGRRMISATAFGGVDISNFPEALISNVETVTGGASAAYGTDAVAGVTNFILNTNFEGMKGAIQGGETTHGDGANYEVSLTWGVKLGDRGHFIISGERFEQQAINSYGSRSWYKNWGTIADSTGMVYDKPNVVSTNISFDGVIAVSSLSSPLYGYAFNPNGSASQFVLAPAADRSYVAATAPVVGGGANARQSLENGGSGDDLTAGDVDTLQPDFTRSNIFGYADYEATDSLKLFAQYIRGYKTTSSYNTPRGLMSGAPTNPQIFQDNAYLPDNIRQIMVANNIASFPFHREGNIMDLAAQAKIWDETWLNSATAGFDWNIDKGGGLFDGWKVEGYYQYGDSKRKAYQVGLRVDRIYAAIDAVKDPSSGQIVCRVSLSAAGRAAYPGCQPIDLFGRGNASQAAVDWVMGYDPGQQITTPLFFANGGYTGATDSYTSQFYKLNTMTMTQNLMELSMNGELFKGWGAGPITVAFGGAYRKEHLRQIVEDPGNKPSDHTLGSGQTQNPCPSAALAASYGLRGLPAAGDCANTVFTQFSKVSNIDGAISVTEGFGEMLVPIIAKTPFFEDLSADLSARWARYTGSGDIWAYKGGLNWTVGEGLRLRGTYSRDVRAANLSERFDVTGGAATVTDPKHGNASTFITTFSGGNPAVKPERGDTFTAGAVYQPTFFRGLSVSLDWYHIKIKDAIGQVGTQNVVNYCNQGQTQYCSLITRDPTTDALVLVGNVYVNINQSVVSGIDLETDYHTNLRLLGGDESLTGRAFGSWLLERSDNGVDRSGETGVEPTTGAAMVYARFKFTSNLTYKNGPFSWFVQGRYISPGTMQNNNTPGPGVIATSDNHVSSVYYVDTNVSYTFKVGGRDLQLFADVTNLFDKAPPLAPYWSTFTNSATQTNAALFDVIGRRFVIGAKVTL